MRLSLAPLLVAAVLLSGCVSAVKSRTRPDTAEAVVGRRALATATIASWHETSALAARVLMQRYGVPDEVHYDRLVWNDNLPWKRTVVRDVTPPYQAGGDLRVIAQTVVYPLSPEEVSDLAAFDGRLSYDARTMELTSRSDSEAVNFLRMNLADDVATRRLTPEQARGRYASILAFRDSGKTSPYLRGLRFTGDPAR